ncbi:S-adenosyl-L-methionine-dependent methyltransferase [Durotheca rogersii]|uniref:S-adenosyl-L-methionine-dependent methyltransferase n=1 Tax=Durotheca rogersii TaxID=419775 RepID=UPI00221ED18D|nr:S-adenosyl-L-methionine-dependent methyltransferase [Durotheca rogersii]KAI5860411.1 S-adenosyl-L-methionine-dependent methyltransferase [Durotheca rogersii]
MTSGSADEILALDVQILIDSLNQDENSKGGGEEEGPAGGAAAAGGEWMDSGNESLPKEGSVIEVHVVELSSTGDGLALQEGSKRIYAVGFVVPGDTVKVKVFRHFQEEKYTIADFISVVNPSPLRDDERIRCKHFATCSGCQFQMLDYNDQLRLKKRIVERAFRNFSQLPPELVPAVQDTIGSPLQYGYRTKLTPHFDGPPNWRQGVPFKACPPIGFMRKGTRTTVDIEDCPIGTDVVRLGMRRERARMAAEYSNYIRGATLLLRETTKRIPKPGFENIIKAGIEDEPPLSPRSKRESAVAVARESPPDDTDLVIVDTNEYTDLKTCITDNNAISTEYVGPYVFHNPAGFFFQNNNSILPTFTDYVRQHIFPPPPSTPTTTSTKDPLSSPSSSPASPDSPIEFLIDAYSGSGLFTITLSSVLRGGSVGVDIAPASIAFGVRNARANGLAPGRARFVAADAHTLFTPELRAACPPDRSVVVVDPPRKGCDDAFLGQLLAFGPRRVVYVSCNVHTQARDVGVLVRGEQPRDADDDAAAAATGRPPVRYAIESLRGFDFFPQTGHVEGVAVLNRVDADEVP